MMKKTVSRKTYGSFMSSLYYIYSELEEQLQKYKGANTAVNSIGKNPISCVQLFTVWGLWQSRLLPFPLQMMTVSDGWTTLEKIFLFFTGINGW
jgi:hypothetical protein